MTNPNHTDTSRSDDLVKRLRERTSYSEILLCHPPRPAPDRLCHEAADRIEALEAEVERLRGVLRYYTDKDDYGERARAALGEKQ